MLITKDTKTNIASGIATIKISSFWKDLFSAGSKTSSMRFVFVCGVGLTVVGSLGLCFYSIAKDGGTAIIGIAAYATGVIGSLSAFKAQQVKNENNNIAKGGAVK